MTDIRLNPSPDMSMEPTPTISDQHLAYAHLKAEITEAVKWGQVNTKKLLERFSAAHSEYFTKEQIARCIEEVFTEEARFILTQHPGAEIMGFLAQSEMLIEQATNAIRNSLAQNEAGQEILTKIFDSGFDEETIKELLPHIPKGLSTSDLAKMISALNTTWRNRISFLKQLGVFSREEILADFTEQARTGKLVPRPETQQFLQQAEHFDKLDASYSLPGEESKVPDIEVPELDNFTEI